MESLRLNHRRQKKEAIIEAAVKVFAEKGFYNSKVTDVAKAAGIADGTIYLYFKNKDDLLISLFESKMEQILKHFNTHLRVKKDPIEKLSYFFELYFELIVADENLSEVIQVELRQSSKFLKDYRNQKFLDYLNIIAGIIDEGKNQDFFRDDINTDIVKIMIFGAIDEVARQWILGADTKYTLKQACQHVTAIIIDGLLKK